MSSRPELIQSVTHKVKAVIPGGVEVKIYVTVGKQDGRPYEVFANTNNAQLWEHLAVVTLMISRLLQAGVPPERIAKDLLQIHSPITGHMARGGYAPSIYARIGSIIVLESGAVPEAQTA